MKAKIDWDKLEKLHMTSWTPEEMLTDTDPFVQVPWDIPKKVAVQVAISGGGARLHMANPNQPRNLDTIIEHASQCFDLPIVPTLTHFDHDNPRAMVTRDGKKMERGDSYMYVIKPLLEKYGREKVLPHCNTMHGTFKQQMLPVVTGLCEMTYNHSMWCPTYMTTVIPIQKEYGVVAEISIHNNTEIEATERVMIKSGLMPNPNLWNLLQGAAARRSPTGNSIYEFYRDQWGMLQHFGLTVQDIKSVDPGATITVCCGGRASSYLATLAILMGCHVRMGMEDTVWRYPHSNQMIKNSAETLTWAQEIVKLLGREVMTPNEYREICMKKPARFDHAETLRPME